MIRFAPAALLVLLLASGLSAEVKDVRKTLPLAVDGQVVIDTYKGRIRVEPWDNAQVEIDARIQADSSLFHSDEGVRDTEIRIDAAPGSVRIKSDYSKLKERRGWGLFNIGIENPEVIYHIRMPRTARLRIKDYKSETEVDGLRSDVEIDTYKGPVRVTGLDGSLQLKTYKSEAHVRFARLAGASRFETYKGEMDVTLPSSAAFSLNLDTDRGEFVSSFPLTLTAARRYSGRDSRRGNHIQTSVNGGGPSIRMTGYRGSFRIRRD